MKTITLSDLKNKLEDQSTFFLIDVREIEEFEQGHIPNALLMPWHIISERINGIKQNRPLVLYCNTGVRALKAAKTLENASYTNISVYPGGWEEWNDAIDQD